MSSDWQIVKTPLKKKKKKEAQFETTLNGWNLGKKVKTRNFLNAI